MRARQLFQGAFALEEGGEGVACFFGGNGAAPKRFRLAEAPVEVASSRYEQSVFACRLLRAGDVLEGMVGVARLDSPKARGHEVGDVSP